MQFNTAKTFRCLTGAALLWLPLAASAAEISIYSGGAVKAALNEATANYEHATGHHVTIEYLPMGTLMRRLAQGPLPDAVVLTADVMPEAESRGWVLPATALPLGGVGVGVAVRAGGAIPDISTPESFKATLLAAKSITYMDPDKGTSGKHFAEVLRRLGIADAMKAKTTLGEGGYIVEPVARGEIELGIQQSTEILPVKGVVLVGQLPEPLQKITVYTAAQTPKARDPEAVRGLFGYLRNPEARKIFAAKGFLTEVAR